MTKMPDFHADLLDGLEQLAWLCAEPVAVEDDELPSKFRLSCQVSSRIRYCGHVSVTTSTPRCRPSFT
ncbi:MAG: hypothetical protein U0414_07280 [Polyangiaceae bacterium]